MKKINCPNCQNQEAKIVLDVSQEKDTYLDYLNINYKNLARHYLQCQECGLIYRNLILDDAEKELLYKHYRDEEMRKEDKYEYFQKIVSLPPRQSENYQKCQFLEKYLPKKGSILDAGCGAGVFLYTFNKYFPEWEVLGIEPTEGFSDVAREKGLKIIYGYLKADTLKEKFDLITLNHVLEHLDRFKEMLIMLKGYLKKEGLLYIEVPSSKDIGELPASHDRFMSPHCLILSKEVLENILSKLGYSITILEDFISVRNRNNLRIIAKVRK